VMKVFAAIALDLDETRCTIARGSLDPAIFRNQCGSDASTRLIERLR